MLKPLLVALPLVLLLGACGASGGSSGGGTGKTWYNPFTWFGGSRNSPADAAVLSDGSVPEDTRPLVAQVLSMSIDQVPGGAIIRATGLPPTQGYWAAELVAQPIEDGRLVYRFVIVAPPVAARVSTQQSREVTVAASVSTLTLDGVREVVVQGANNARSSRR